MSAKATIHDLRLVSRELEAQIETDSEPEGNWVQSMTRAKAFLDAEILRREKRLNS